jgi:hypothetical protein
MRRILAVFVVSVLVGACGGPEVGETTPEIMAVALTQLVTVDNTFGGAMPFTEFLIQTGTDPTAGDVAAPPDGPTRPLTDEERAAIEEAISEYGSVRWIDDPADWRTPQLTPVVEGSVILGVGEPNVEEDTALVPVSLWCGGLCGAWFSYRADLVDGEWTVTGIEGPVAIS